MTIIHRFWIEIIDCLNWGWKKHQTRKKDNLTVDKVLCLNIPELTMQFKSNSKSNSNLHLHAFGKGQKRPYWPSGGRGVGVNYMWVKLTKMKQLTIGFKARCSVWKEKQNKELTENKSSIFFCFETLRKLCTQISRVICGWKLSDPTKNSKNKNKKYTKNKQTKQKNVLH